MVAVDKKHGECVINYQEVGGSSWDYHNSPLSLGIQANVRPTGDDTLTVDFRGAAGAKGGGAVGAGVGDFSVGLDIPDTTMANTTTLRTSTTWKAYHIDVAPPPVGF